MQNLTRFTFGILCLLCLLPLTAQRIVHIPANPDPNQPVDIYTIIQGDTTATGERTDNNTIYTLENGELYIVRRQIVNKPDWPLQIQAQDLTDTENKPRITRIPNSSGVYPNVFWPEGDMTLRNLWVVAGERGPGAQHDWGKIRLYGENSKVVIDHCIIEKDRGGFLQVNANNIRCYVNNSIFRNGGNRKIFQGNGRGIDGRNYAFDSLVVTQSVFHNIADRILRSQGGVEPHNYIEFDHNTIFNHVGRHGCFQFGLAKTVKITNNLLRNPILLGSTPAFTDEQTQPDNESFKVFTLDTLYDDANLEFAANNIYYTQDVLDLFNSIDSVSRPEVYSDLILQHLGASAPSTYFEEVVELEAVPPSILEYIEDVYANPAATDMYDFIVEDISLAGTPLDFGNLFDFSTFSPCYPATAISATAATDGGAVGAVDFCSELSTDTYAPELTRQLKFSLSPNPVGAFTTIIYELAQAGPVRIAIYDAVGREVSVIHHANQAAGIQRVDWQPAGTLPKGIYVARLQTRQGEQSLKFVSQ
ncbi:T9SS type A sorting domain-containing protein [Neolewinella aurantiaca]|uniref:T9SS type A sorting domain-containing protein n=1 Tax=Neolewinella aurantiaca TaxID=2602767 RepID=A0A5C7FK95_9BACT|nr:T9SS type A sorting domain-containing protein [Neolewinella aurantiaca]TXF91768.1 T9SS type A sorting domain-containing protein [Neolewinella aurantiaca]